MYKQISEWEQAEKARVEEENKKLTTRVLNRIQSLHIPSIPNPTTIGNGSGLSSSGHGKPAVQHGESSDRRKSVGPVGMFAVAGAALSRGSSSQNVTEEAPPAPQRNGKPQSGIVPLKPKR